MFGGISLENKYLSISDFSRLSSVSRKALIYYDRIGLFKPDFVKENGYRYYSHHQIETITVINTLSGSGMSLEQIKEFTFDARLLPGHGEESTLKYEQQNNPYLKS